MNNKKVTCKKIFYVIIQFIILYLSIGLWSIICEYLVYDKNKFNSNIIENLLLGWISLILNIFIGSLFMILSVAILLIGGWDNRNKIFPHNSNEKSNMYCKCMSMFITIIILCCSYFGFFVIETYVQDKTELDIFSSNSFKYAFCGFIKIVPIMGLLGFTICKDSKSKKSNTSSVVSL